MDCIATKSSPSCDDDDEESYGDDVGDEGFPIEAPISGTKAKGSMWVEKIERLFDLTEFENDDTYKFYMARCPYPPNSKSLLRRIYKLLATSSVEMVSTFVGLRECPVNEETKTAIDAHVENILGRGNVGGRANDNFRTNESFLRRQAEFLEFMEAHSDLKTGFQELVFITKRTEEDLSHFTWRLSNDEEKHSFVSENAALDYLKQKDKEKRLNKEVLLEGMEGVIDITSFEVQQQLNQWIKHAQHFSQESKRQRVDKPDFVQPSDLGQYTSALAELQVFQSRLLGIESMHLPLRSSTKFKRKMKSKLKMAKDHQMLHTMDKSSRTISDLPTRHQIQKLIHEWYNVNGNRQAIHAGMCNASAFLNMCISILRGDSLLRCKYSNLFALKHSDFTKPASIFDLTYFVNVSDESKTNRCGSVEYSCKIHNMIFPHCAALSESMMIITRHDICCVPIPDGTKMVKLASNILHRTWHDDSLYIDLEKRTDFKYKVDGEEFEGVDCSLKLPINIDCMSRRWRATYKETEIKAKHTIHLCRQEQTIVNGFKGIDQSQTAHIGRWQTSNDVMAACYDKLPNSSTLVRMANCESMEDYTPYRLLLDPPEELLKIVLPEFDNALEAATKRNEEEASSNNEAVRGIKVDQGYVNMCIYISELRLLFVRCSPYLSQFLKPDHILFSHPLFHHPLYESWSRSSRLLTATLAKLEGETSLSLSRLKGLRFKTKSSGGHLDILPTTTSDDQALKQRIESIFTEVCNDMTKSVKKSLDHSNSTPIDIGNESITLVDNIPDQFIDESVKRLEYCNIRLEVSELKKTVTECLVLDPRTTKRSIHACYGSNTLGVTSEGERGGDEVNDLKVDSSEDSKIKAAEVQSLPPLSIVDKSPTPIGDLYKLWSVGDNKNRSLKQVCAQPASGLVRWASRGIQNSVQRIRSICTAIELCALDGQSLKQAIQNFEIYKREKKFTINALANEISEQLKINHVTKPRKAIDSSKIYASPAYASEEFFWKSFV